MSWAYYTGSYMYAMKWRDSICVHPFKSIKFDTVTQDGLIYILRGHRL